LKQHEVRERIEHARGTGGLMRKLLLAVLFRQPAFSRQDLPGFAKIVS